MAKANQRQGKATLEVQNRDSEASWLAGHGAGWMAAAVASNAVAVAVAVATPFRIELRLLMLFCAFGSPEELCFPKHHERKSKHLIIIT